MYIEYSPSFCASDPGAVPVTSAAIWYTCSQLLLVDDGILADLAIPWTVPALYNQYSTFNKLAIGAKGILPVAASNTSSFPMPSPGSPKLTYWTCPIFLSTWYVGLGSPGIAKNPIWAFWPYKSPCDQVPVTVFTNTVALLLFRW